MRDLFFLFFRITVPYARKQSLILQALSFYPDNYWPCPIFRSIYKAAQARLEESGHLDTALTKIRIAPVPILNFDSNNQDT